MCDYVQSQLMESLIEDCQFYGVSHIAYDPYNAAHSAELLEQEGLTPVKMPQNHGHFNEIMDEYFQEIAEDRLTPCHDDAILRWCALNMALDTKPDGRKMPSKKHSRGKENAKIDAIVAVLMAKRANHLTLARCQGPLVL